jgi:hypothetical protein
MHLPIARYGTSRGESFWNIGRWIEGEREPSALWEPPTHATRFASKGQNCPAGETAG